MHGYALRVMIPVEKWMDFYKRIEFELRKGRPMFDHDEKFSTKRFHCVIFSSVFSDDLDLVKQSLPNESTIVGEYMW